MSSVSQPLVSVIIPTFNYARFIAEAVASVQSQTYSNWEMVVVDDGSTDQTCDVVQALAKQDRRITYVRQSNQGLAAARNKGIQHARGDYVQFLDADDSLEPQKLERQVQFLAQHPEVDIIFSDARYFRSENPEERRFSQYEDDIPWVAKIRGTGDEVLMRLIENNIMVVNAPLLRRSVVTDVGLFEPSVRGVEDWDYWIRCAAAGKQFLYDDSDGARALVRFHGTSMSTDARLMLRSTLLLHKRLCALSFGAKVRELNFRRMSEKEGWLGVEEVRAGHLFAGLRHMVRAAITSRVMRHRAKWLICAATAPFVSGDRLKRMVTSSLSGLENQPDSSRT